MALEIARYHFTVSDYARMRETGILAEDDRVELIDGEVRVMSPIGPLHAAIVKRLNILLMKCAPSNVIISVQDPIQLNDNSEPQPDLAIVVYRSDFYADAHPAAKDVLMVIEVSDSTLDYDRDEKVPRYAAALIAEAWIVDLQHQTIERYTQPRHGKYLTTGVLQICANRLTGV
jgi:Uma2 family endonuclease